MKKCKTFITLLLAILIANFSLVSSVYSQVSDLLKQNSIQTVTLTEIDGEPVLVFKGNIKTLQETDILIGDTEGGNNQFSIRFSNSLWDSMDTGIITKTFNPDDPISTVEIANEMDESGEKGAVFTVMVKVNTRDMLKAELIAPILPTEVKFRLKGGSGGMAESTLMQETKNAADQQMQVEQGEQKAQVKAKESVDAIIQQYRKPSIMQVSIYNASGYPKRAYGLSVYLGKLKKEYIEETLGMKMEIVNISNAPTMNHRQSSIYFRNNYLKPALFLAKLIKGDQKVIPYKGQQEKQGVDIEIYLGKDYK
jgi:hypothetical protein